MGEDYARHVLRLLDNPAETQGTLNGLAFRLGLVTPEADAATVNGRLRVVAESAVGHG